MRKNPSWKGERVKLLNLIRKRGKVELKERMGERERESQIRVRMNNIIAGNCNN